MYETRYKAMKLKGVCLSILVVSFSSMCLAEWKLAPSGSAITSEPLYQETKSGGLGQATFMMMKGSIVYVTTSKTTKDICKMYPDVIDDSPIVVEDINLPASSWCSEGSVLTSIEGDAARWLFERFWKQRNVVIDGWNVDTTGFQQAVRELGKSPQQ